MSVPVARAHSVNFTLVVGVEMLVTRIVEVVLLVNFHVIIHRDGIAITIVGVLFGTGMLSEGAVAPTLLSRSVVVIRLVRAPVVDRRDHVVRRGHTVDLGVNSNLTDVLLLVTSRLLGKAIAPVPGALISLVHQVQDGVVVHAGDFRVGELGPRLRERRHGHDLELAGAHLEDAGGADERILSSVSLEIRHQ